MLRSLLPVVLFLLMVWSASRVMALEVADAVMTTAIVNREPVDSVGVFPLQSERLYCFTRMTGADQPTFVYHLWYRGGQLMSRVELPVNSPSWRTWSAKDFLQEDPGDWRVEIQDGSGRILRQLVFRLR